jgi:hypothetical protein
MFGSMGPSMNTSSLVLPAPSRPSECVSPLGPKGGRSNGPLRVMEYGGPNSDDWKESLVLCILCAHTSPCPEPELHKNVIYSCSLRCHPSLYIRVLYYQEFTFIIQYFT